MPTQRTRLRAKLLFIGELLNEYFDKLAVASRQKKSFVLLQQLDLALLHVSSPLGINSNCKIEF